jgi:hypothetical protein
LDPELAAKTDPPHLYRRFHVATLWCDHVARCAGTQKISMEFASSELPTNGARRIKRSLNPGLEFSRPHNPLEQNRRRLPETINRTSRFAER